MKPAVRDRVSPEEGLRLFKEGDLLELGERAQTIRFEKKSVSAQR
jgi:hypothetical protein